MVVLGDKFPWSDNIPMSRGSCHQSYSKTSLEPIPSPCIPQHISLAGQGVVPWGKLMCIRIFWQNNPGHWWTRIGGEMTWPQILEPKWRGLMIVQAWIIHLNRKWLAFHADPSHGTELTNAQWRCVQSTEWIAGQFACYVPVAWHVKTQNTSLNEETSPKVRPRYGVLANSRN